jgi:hypothetical protein
MIHYINGVPAKNLQMHPTYRTARAHALTSYRAKQARALIKDTIIRATIVLAVSLTLAAVYLIRTS